MLIKVPRLGETGVWEGKWWLPDATNSRVAGILSKSREGSLKLKLLGSLGDPAPIGEAERFSIIFGELHSGEAVTLESCFVTHAKESDPGFTVLEIRASKALLGLHSRAPMSEKSQVVSFSFNNLTSWVDRRGIKNALHEISYEHPETVRVFLDDETELVIYHTLRKSTSSSPSFKTTIEQSARMSLVHSEPQALDHSMKIIRRVEEFLSLAVGEPLFLMEVRTEQTTTPAHDEIPVESILLQELPGDLLERRSLMPHEMNFPLKEIGYEFDKLIRNWLESSRKLEVVHDLYFGTMYNQHMYANHEFLSLSHAVESLHRLVIGGAKKSKEEHRKLVASIVEAVPCEHEGWLEENLQWSNELNLQDRLEQLWDKNSKILDKVIGERDEFLRLVKKTRNYYTHWDEQTQKGAAKGKDLLMLTQKVRAFLEVCLLSEIGFNRLTVLRVAENSISRYNFY